MRPALASKFLALATMTSRSASGFSPSMVSNRISHDALTRRFLTSNTGEIQLKHIGWEEMDALIDEFEELGREESGLVIMDVRNSDEIASTGKLSPNTITLPLGAIMQYNVFALDEDDFEDMCGFAKPTPDETLVFSCAAGVRSVHAANFAAQSGYTKLVNYAGGANEWFTRG